MRDFFLIFVSVFLAELGDKTQIATLLFASQKEYGPVLVLMGAAAALIAATAAAVLLGVLAQDFLARLPLQLFAGLGFIAIGAWTLADYFWS